MSFYAHLREKFRGFDELLGIKMVIYLERFGEHFHFIKVPPTKIFFFFKLNAWVTILLSTPGHPLLMNVSSWFSEICFLTIAGLLTIPAGRSIRFLLPYFFDVKKIPQKNGKKRDC